MKFFRGFIIGLPVGVVVWTAVIAALHGLVVLL
jgi:hypothetical protein